jgi:hypothetical protein
MSREDDNNRHVRRVVLPSGKTIDVVYFEEHPDPVRVPPAQTGDELHVCRSCESPLVHPVDWEEAGATHWEVTLRCPECEWTGTGVFEQALIDRFDAELDRGTETLARDLQRMVHANMEDEIERFVLALEGDHILPDDF